MLGEIRHVVVVMLENRSYDHLFGLFPRGEGIPPWYAAVHPKGDPASPPVRPTLATADWHPDWSRLNPNYWAMRAAMNGGRMDLFPLATGEASMTVVDRRHVPNLWWLAENFVLADRYFQSVVGPTLPNRLYSLAAQCGGWLSNRIPPEPLTYPTIFDRLTDAGISWGYFQGGYRRWMYHLPPRWAPRGLEWQSFMPIYLFPSLHGDRDRWDAHVGSIADFLVLLRRGGLPAFSYVTPHPLHTMHPGTPLSAGDAWLGRFVRALMESASWQHLALFVTFDDSGGYFDHVPPPQPTPYGFGPRVPLLVVSPHARKGTVYSRTADHASLLAFVERRWGLEPLTAWDAAADPLLDAFDLA